MPIVLSSYFPLMSEGVVNRTVFGTVLDSLGNPMESVTVAVKTEALDGVPTDLGAPVVTSSKGSYSFTYDLGASKPAIIQVSLPAVSGTPTEVVVAPADNEQVDFKVGALASTNAAARYTDVSARLDGVLALGQLPLSALDGRGIARLGMAAGVHPDEVALARDANVSATLAGTPAATFFALARGGLTANVNEVLKHTSDDRADAVAQAIATGILSETDAAATAAALADLDSEMINSALINPDTVATPALAFQLAQVGTGSTILAQWKSHTGTLDDFWDSLVDVSAGQKSALQYALHLDHVTRSNASLIRHLFATYGSPVALATLTPGDWSTLVASDPSYAAPAFIKNPADYPLAIFKAVEDAFPTDMLSARGGAFGSAGSAIVSFIAGNSAYTSGDPPYALNGLSLREFLVKYPDAIQAAGNQAAQDALTSELPILERLYRISPRGARFEVMQALRAANITSATQIQLMGRARFMTLLGDTLNALGGHAEYVFRRARAAGSTAVMLQLRHRTPPSGGRLPVLPTVPDDPTEGTTAPITWDSMFGGRSYCACSECQSAHGPAAYLTDLLFWLRSRDVDGALLNQLLARRADLEGIELSCKNTNTALPTIDLILEQLESILEPSGGPSARQTTLDANELAAAPEHVNVAAYERLAGKTDYTQFYPFDQPYVAPLDAARTFFKGLGIERAMAMVAMTDGGPAAALAIPEIGAELLGMTRTSWAILSDQLTAPAAARWGMSGNLFARTPVWVGSASSTGNELDKDGGTGAVLLTDSSNTDTQFATASSSGYLGGTILGGLYIKKDVGATGFAEIRLGIGGDFSDDAYAFVLDVTNGANSGGTWTTLNVTEDSGWWKINFSHAGAAPSSTPTELGVRITPAAGASYPTLSGAATGSVTVYSLSSPITGTTDTLTQVSSSDGAVPTFLRQAGDRAAERPMTYAELEDLLRSRYVQDAGNLSIAFDNVTCDIDGATLVSSVIDDHLVRLSKLIRLSHDLGWTVPDLDRAIALFRTSPAGDLQSSDISESLLKALAAVRWIQRMTGLAPAEILNWWGPLDTRRWLEQLVDGTPVDPVKRIRVPALDTANARGDAAEPSPFQRMIRQLKEAALFAVTDDGTELASVAELLADHLDSVAAIIGVDPRDVAPLVDAMAEATGSTPALNLGNISLLYRQVRLCRALSISTTEFLDWTVWLGLHPFGTAGDPTQEPFGSPLDTVAFVSEVKRNATLHVSHDEMTTILGVLNERDLSTLSLPSAGEAMLALADEVRAHSSLAVADAFDLTALSSGNLLPAPAASASSMWTASSGATIADGVMEVAGVANAAVVGDPTTTAAESVTATSDAYPGDSAAQPVWASIWVRKVPAADHFVEIAISYESTEAARVALDLEHGTTNVQSGTFSEVAVVDARDWWFIVLKHAGSTPATHVGLTVYPAAGATFPTPAIATQGEVTIYGPRIALATGHAADPRYTMRDRAIVRRTAALLNLDVTLTSKLLDAADYGVGVSAFDKLLKAANDVASLRDGDPGGSADPEEVIGTLLISDIWELVALTGWMCRAFAFRAEDIDWLFDAPTSTRGFDVESIALSRNYGAWASLREAARLQKVASNGHLFDLFGKWLATTPPAATIRDDLAARTQWPLTDLAAAITDAFDGPFGEGSAAAWASPALFARLAAWLELARGLRVPAETLASWALPVWPDYSTETEPVTEYEQHAAQLEQALRGAWGAERWFAEEPGIREGMRDRQRRALLSRIVGDPGFPDLTSSDAVGQRLLMDVQMGACAKTSRIKDAIRTVQAFVERLLLGEEGTFSLTDEEASEWVWRRSFRLWEANRKVFLYPENWLRPELRREKTPFFEQLENDLASGDLRDELVEDAYASYLRRLADVAKLDVLAVLHETRAAGPDVYHVFGRNRVLPTAYYYRSWTDGGRWSPWTVIPHVEGEHLVPVIFQRRLILFWLNISDTAAQPPSTHVSTQERDQPSPSKYFNIRVAHSEFRDGGWSGAIKSDAFIGIDERGSASPVGLVRDSLVSYGVLPGGAAPLTYPTTVIHAHAGVEGHDLVIRVFRDFTRAADAPAPLGKFRMSGVDGGVTVEDADANIMHSAPPSYQGTVAFDGRAQRFYCKGSSPLGLKLPVAHPSSPAASLTRVLMRDAAAESDWIQISPSSRVEFDPTAPMVFEDNLGSYWVTHQQMRFFGPIGFPGWFWHGSDRELKLFPAITRGIGALDKLAVSLSVDAERPFRSKHTGGPDAFLGGVRLFSAVNSGKNIAAVNANATDKSAKAFAVNTAFNIADSSGITVYQGRAGLTWNRDELYSIRSTFQEPVLKTIANISTEGFHFLTPARGEWRFDTFFHPHIGAMRETLNRLGVLGLLDPPPTTPPQEPEALADQDPTPDSTLETRYTDLPGVSHTPPDDLDFSSNGAYSDYNWELFFHAPLLVASRLHEAGQYENALKWLKVIFDPFRPAQAGASGDDASRSVWRFRPFRDEFVSGSTPPRNIQQLIAILTASADDPAALAEARELLQEIIDWRRDPFDPHAIARTRHVAYMAAVVMKYLEVLLDWGDQLFSQNTLESIGEAAEYYLLAARILGPRPEQISVGDVAPMTFGALLSDFVSGVGPAETTEESLAIETWEVLDEEFPNEANSLASFLYFCVPANPDLATKYWDRVADRLFKIRNCLDIQGRREELALFEPPIDPNLLVQAAASGVDLQSVMADIVTGVIPHRRYLAMAELAAGLASAAQGLGQALLVAIEKRDADQLSTLRNTHEAQLQQDAITARKDQITDLQHQLDAMRTNRDAAKRRFDYYDKLRQQRTNSKEAMQLTKARQAKTAFKSAGDLATIASVVALIPDIDLGTAGAGGSPVVTARFGGSSLAAALNAEARHLETNGGALDREASRLLTESGYDRRLEDWQLQADLAQKDIEATDARILSTRVQIALAEAALVTAERRADQIQEIQDFYEQRFARDDLYDWLASQLTGLHYQSYQLAYEFAKKAERAWQYELGRNDTFIQFGYWDSRRKGLLAGDRLGHDLRRMQVAYTELSTRRLEVEQTFSVREIDPGALLALQATGQCEFDLPEAFFDLHYPGQYCRRIRAVRFTVPAVIPPNTNVPVQAELLRHWVRRNAADVDATEGGYGTAPVTMTATSSAQRDGGVFELNFSAPRLLPFEGAGAVSRWRLTLPKAVRSFSYHDIQDVYVHVAYDALYSGTLRDSLESGAPSSVLSHLFATSPGRRRIISLRQEFGGALRRLVQAGQTQVLPFSVSFALTDAILPTYLRNSASGSANPRVVLYAGSGGTLQLKLNNVATGTWAGWSEAGGLPSSVVATAFAGGLIGTHTLEVTAWDATVVSDPDFDVLISVDLS